MDQPVHIDENAKIDGQADGTAQRPYPSVWAALGHREVKRAAEAESDRQPGAMTG